MAIIIPSKNIYDIKNPKIRDNLINKVNVAHTVVSPKNEYNIPVYNVKSDNFHYMQKDEIDDFQWDFRGEGVTIDPYMVVSYIKFIPYIIELNVKIPKLRTNSYISELILGKDKQDNFNISISVFYKVQETPSTAEIFASGEPQIDKIVDGNTTETNQNKSFNKLTQEDLTETFIDNSQRKISATVFERFNENYSKIAYDILGNKEFQETEEFYSFDISFLSGYEKLTYSGENLDPIIGEWWKVNGTRLRYIPQQITVTINGNTIGIDLTESNISIGKGDKPYSLDGNELIQDSGTTKPLYEEAKPTTEFLGSLINSNYKNGKETATLLCSIGEYKNENGDIAISTKDTTLPMLFKIGDVVIPRVFSYTGDDVPMSKYKDGSPKQFEVVKVNFIDDGAVWQELTLQEYTFK